MLLRYLILNAIFSVVTYSSMSAIEAVTYDFDEHITYKTGALSKKETSFYTEHFKPVEQKAEIKKRAKKYNKRLSELQETVLMRVVSKEDGRRRIDNTTKWPYSFHSQLALRYKDVYTEKEYGGSGVLVGPHHLLTAAHNVYNHQTKKWASDITVHLGLNDTISPFGEYKAVKAYTFKQYIEGKDEARKHYDMALIVLDDSIGYVTGWSGLQFLGKKDLKDKEVHITGYPGDEGKDFKQMWTMSHTIKTVKGKRLYYDIDTYGGQSGSGLWYYDTKDHPYVVGIHTRGEENEGEGNSGVRLSKSKFKLIYSWISETMEINKAAESLEDSQASSSSSVTKNNLKRKYDSTEPDTDLSPSPQKKIKIYNSEMKLKELLQLVGYTHGSIKDPNKLARDFLTKLINSKIITKKQIIKKLKTTPHYLTTFLEGRDNAHTEVIVGNLENALRQPSSDFTIKAKEAFNPKKKNKK